MQLHVIMLLSVSQFAAETIILLHKVKITCLQKKNLDRFTTEKYVCYKCIFIRVLNQVGINETMVSTALVLCANSRFFALKILCTEHNDWKHALLELHTNYN